MNCMPGSTQANTDRRIHGAAHQRLTVCIYIYCHLLNENLIIKYKIAFESHIKKINMLCRLYYTLYDRNVRSRQGRVLQPPQGRTSTRATESVSYDIAIERSTSRTGERANERASRQVPSRHLCLPRCGCESMWYQVSKKLSSVSMNIVFTLTHHHPRKISLVTVPGYTFPPPPLTGERHQSEIHSTSILPYH